MRNALSLQICPFSVSLFTVDLTMLKTHYNKSALFLSPFSVDLTMNKTVMWFLWNVTVPRKLLIWSNVSYRKEGSFRFLIITN